MHVHKPNFRSQKLQASLSLAVVAVLVIVGSLFLKSSNPTPPAQPSDDLGSTTYQQAVVVTATDLQTNPEGGFSGVSQAVKVKLLSTKQTVDIGIQESGVVEKLKVGDRVVVSLTNRIDGSVLYGLVDNYRLPAILWVAAIFVILLLVLAGWHGLSSMFGLVFSVVMLTTFVVPQILSGQNPIAVMAIAAFIIAVISIYLSHGFSARTTIAVVGVLLTLVFAFGLAYTFMIMASLSGAGTEEAFYLSLDSSGGISLRGLLLGGIVIGTLGVLDDITTAQSATVEELYLANHKLSFSELYRRGFSVGKEHIISLVNTLALAYVGASMPLLLLFATGSQPLWVLINSQMIAEEIVRTLVGSAALILAVPITTYLAAKWFSSRPSQFTE